ncbi:MAG: SRPBCC family protein [Nocardioidaceae bacterium]
MNEVSRVFRCSPEAVFDVLSDGWSYATWVVGAARIRRVDEGFPAPGTKVHHSIGLWPVLLSDDTEVEEFDPPRKAQLLARAWPGGEARVVLTCEPVAEGTEVTMRERVVNGPASLIPGVVQDAMLRARNKESLMRLAFLAERAARSDDEPVQPH